MSSGPFVEDVVGAQVSTMLRECEHFMLRPEGEAQAVFDSRPVRCQPGASPFSAGVPAGGPLQRNAAAS